MSILATDNNSNAVQAFRLPHSGSSAVLATIAAANVSSPALAAGMYRIISTANIAIASGKPGSIATATDLPMCANAPEYFYVNGGETINAFDQGAGGATVSYSKMP